VKSWKTTVAAVLGVAIFVLAKLGVEVVPVEGLSEVLGLVLGILGVGVSARDNDKSSEDVGAGDVGGNQ